MVKKSLLDKQINRVKETHYTFMATYWKFQGPSLDDFKDTKEYLAYQRANEKLNESLRNRELEKHKGIDRLRLELILSQLDEKQLEIRDVVVLTVCSN